MDNNIKISNKIKDMDIKNHSYYFLDDIDFYQCKFSPDNIKIDEESYKNIIYYYIEYLKI